MSDSRAWTREDLSRLLDAELDFEQAKQLRKDLDTEPELAARWEKMLRLDADLSALNDHPAPPHLDQSILENAPTPKVMAPQAQPSKRWAYALLAVGVLLAATPLLALTDWAQEPAEFSMANGSQWVTGTTQIRLPDGRTLQVDGRALILVEAPTPLPRGGTNKQEMNPQVLLAAATGAAITITVYEGRATLHGPDGNVEVAAGESHSTRPGRTITATVPTLGEPPAP